MRRSAAVVAAVLTAFLLIPPWAQASRAMDTVDVQPWFEWSMVDRYGIDTDLDGLVDMPNTAAYVHGTVPPRCDPTCPEAVFQVALEAHIGESTVGSAIPFIDYSWHLQPETGPVRDYVLHVPRLIVELPEGRTRVTLQVSLTVPFGSFGVVTHGTIDVEDILVVAIGDSYASGEGNPELHRGQTGGEPRWGDGSGSTATEADHAQARRSSLAWPSQVAMDLEHSDPRTSVTFVSVAASSASVGRGLLGPQNTRLPESQVPRVADLVGDRQIDLLLVSIGGNDIGFSLLIAGLVDADPWLDPVCYETDLRNVWDAVGDGQWNRVSRIKWHITNPFDIRCRSVRVNKGATLAGLDGLPGELDRLAAAIEADLHPTRVLIMEYPDPTGFSTGTTTEICDEIVGDAAPLGLHEISTEEQRLAGIEVLDPLNALIREAAQRHGWDYAAGSAASFADGHGYCAEWPDYGYPMEFGHRLPFLRDRLDYPDAWYRNGGLDGTQRLEGPVSWYRTAGQSVALQGPDSRVDTTGTMHPNELGHRAMADLVLVILQTP
jgi:lysophospholipase L1-like esterase